MLSQLRPAAILLAVLTVITGVIYPLFVTAIARVAFPRAATGSVLVSAGRLVGSDLVGQSFTSPRYFWGRLSATSPNPYDARSSSGSNLGPTNPALIEHAKARLEALRAAGDVHGEVPVDLVTASASGLDPHISPAAAAWQVERVARVRGLAPSAVRALVDRTTEPRTFGLLGEPRVNVLRLNLALDALPDSRSARPAWSTRPSAQGPERRSRARRG